MRLFLVHDADDIRHRLSPALAECARRRSFAPLTELIAAATPRMSAAAARDRLASHEQPTFLHLDRIHFDRRTWRHVAGELLLYTAMETPASPLAPDLLRQWMDADLVDRLHRGSRDLSLGGRPYRPDAAGLHDADDVSELVSILAAIDPATWSADVLIDTPPDERDEELEYARQRFRDLRQMFASAKANGQVIVCEEV